MRPPLVVTDAVRKKALVWGVEAWLDGLSDLVVALATDWGLRVGRSLGGGSEAFVAEVTCSDGTPAVLKLLVPRPGEAARDEATALRLADGEGCARLFRSDVERGALLVERLGRGLSELALPIRRRHDILCDTAARVWRPAPGCGLPSGADKGRWLVEFITTGWERLGEPCSERVVEHALACADRRVAAHDDERAVLVHGDVHVWNTFEDPARPGAFKLIDPDGLHAEAEYDLAVVMREDPVDLLGGGDVERAGYLAAQTGLDPAAVWEWGVVERVSTALVLSEIGLETVASEMFFVAERIARDLRRAQL